VNNSSRVRVWQSSALDNTIFLHADHPNHKFDRHFHDGYAIGVIDSGCQAFLYENARRMDMPEGSVALISPGIPHWGGPGSQRGWQYRMLYPSTALVGRALEDIFEDGRARNFNSPVVYDAALKNMLADLHSACAVPEVDDIEVESRFLVVVRHAFSKHAGVKAHNNSNDPRAANKMRELIEDEFDRNVSLLRLANTVGMSRFQALRSFKVAFGLPPHAYLRQLRVRNAHALISRRLPLSKVAIEVGFFDQAHMNRAFRRTVGYTPGVLLKAAGAISSKTLP
jgi:AraC-like DNA-binding protein